MLEVFTLFLCAGLLTNLLKERGRSEHPAEFGITSIVLFTFYYSYYDYWDGAHPELWEATALIGAAAVAVHDDKPVRRALSVGLLCGVAFMFKFPAAIIALPIAAYVGLRAVLGVRAEGERWPRPGRALAALVKAAALYLGGMFAVFAACAVPFVLGGAWGPMWEVLYTYTSRYVEFAPPLLGTPPWLHLQTGIAALIIGGVGYAIAFIAYHKRGAREGLLRGLFLFILLLAALASVILQKRYFSYHFVVAGPFLAAGVILALRGLCGGHMRTAIGLAAAFMAMVFVAQPRWCSNPNFSYLAHTENVAQWLREDIGRNRYLRPFIGMNYLDRYSVMEKIGLQIRDVSQPGDTLCARGFAPPIYQVSGLRCPSRHVIQAWPGLPEWESEFFRTIKKQPPTFIVTFEDRPDELRKLRRMGYKKTDLPGMFVLLTHKSAVERVTSQLAERKSK